MSSPAVTILSSASNLSIPVSFALLSAGLFYVAFALYTALLGPLSKIPGPLLNRLTAWPLRLRSMRGERVLYLQEISQQYGPTAVVAPGLVSVNDLAAVKQIHKIGAPFRKTSWYEAVTIGGGGPPGMFAMRDPKEHAARRRLFSKQFSRSGLSAFDAPVKQAAEEAVRGMRRYAEDGKVDIMRWWGFMAVDLMGEMLFGRSFGQMQSGETSQYIRDLNQKSFIASLRIEFPNLTRFLWMLPIKSIREVKDARMRVSQEGRSAYMAYRTARLAGTASPTIFDEMEDVVDVNLAENEAKNIFIAGTDTTVVTLTYLVWIILKRPDVKARLSAELSQNLEHDWTIPDLEHRMPYLNNVVTEGLRLYGAGPGSLPRSVPKGGSMLGEHFIPGSAEVITQAWCLHRDENIYTDPYSFKPERWDIPTRDMKDAFMPFGSGTRVCLGQHLARMELLAGLVCFFKTFPAATLAPTTTDDAMAVVNFFLIFPKSHRCVVQLM